MLIFLNMNSQSNETGIFDVLEIKISAAQPWWAVGQRIFSKFFLWILYFHGCISVTFLRKQKNVKVF